MTRGRVSTSQHLPAICILLVIVTASVYGAVFAYPFIDYDDLAYVTENEHVQAGLSWQTLTWALTTGDASNWHPLTWFSHALDCQIFGLDASGHHLTNLLIHILNVLLLFLLLKRVTGAVGRSALVAALFGLHPFNVESVAWIAERKNLLSTFFFLLTLAAYGWYAQQPTWKRYCAVAALFILGLAAKPMVITLPCVLFLLDYWPLGRIQGWTTPSRTFPVVQFSWLRLLAEKLLLLPLSAGSAVITIIVQKAAHSIGGPLGDVPIRLRFENAVYSYWRYLAKTFWPANFALIYPHPLNTLRVWQFVLPAVLLVAVSLFVWKQRARRGYLLTGWLWFLGTLVPVIGVIQVGGQGMADRYAYLPTIGIFLMVVWATGEWVEARHINSAAAACVAVAVLLVLSFITVHQVGYWRSSYDLYAHTLDITRDNFLANDVMASLLLKRGSPEAVGYYQEAARLAPWPKFRAHVYTSLGVLYRLLGDYPQARESSHLALSLDSEEVHGLIRALSEQVAERPSAPDFWRLGLLLEGVDEVHEARSAYEKALQLNPQFSPARTALEALSKNQ